MISSDVRVAHTHRSADQIGLKTVNMTSNSSINFMLIRFHGRVPNGNSHQTGSALRGIIMA